jgi:hypothetical protein
MFEGRSASVLQPVPAAPVAVNKNAIPYPTVDRLIDGPPMI